VPTNVVSGLGPRPTARRSARAAGGGAPANRARRDTALFGRYRDAPDRQGLALRVGRVVDDLTCGLGRQPSVDEVAREIGIEAEDVLEAMLAAGAHHATSLDTPRAGGDEDPGVTLGDTLGHAEEGYADAEHRAVLQTLMGSLTLRERNVVRLRFEKDLTSAEIGEIVGVSQMQVCRTLRQSLARLRIIAKAHS